MVGGCNTDHIKDAQSDNKILCHVTSNDAGEFVFGTIPSGDYYIIPYYQGQNIYFQPEQIQFTIKHNSIQLTEHFEVNKINFGLLYCIINYAL